jgi:hypothetical protein
MGSDKNFMKATRTRSNKFGTPKGKEENGTSTRDQLLIQNRLILKREQEKLSRRKGS